MSEISSQIRVPLGETYVSLDLDRGIALAASTTDEPRLPLYWKTPAPRKAPLEVEGFIGDLKRGGPCQVDTVTWIPHCHGTHTETVSHIAEPLVSIDRMWMHGPVLARLVSVAPCRGRETNESYDPHLTPDDRVVTGEALRGLLSDDTIRPRALIIRSMSRDPDLAAGHEPENAPFFTHEAMQCIMALDCQHLLVDFPSVDRLHDEGRLSNHRLFWNLPPGGRQISPSTRVSATITELILVPPDVPDGWYGLEVHLPGWRADAAPSRPILYPIRPDESEGLP